MFRMVLKSKIHKAKVTEANLHYEGSLTIDSALMCKADIVEGEKIEVFNLNNGIRFDTYAIKGKEGSGQICLNGPAARLGLAGDEIIVVSYITIDDERLKSFKPRIVYVDDKNRPLEVPK
jgi:aspartate 1-decarboxylase